MESTDSSTSSQQPQLPPGFRFHPTDEELVVHYLKKKAASAPLPVAIIAEVDLYKFDPWELPAKAIFGEQEWYFFSPRDRKYPNGARPNRAATSGYWKATGTDKPVVTAGGTHKVGVKKALVFYGGKPPKGIKTNWIMHEYRLVDNAKPSTKPPASDFPNKKPSSLRLDDWVLCRIYKKNTLQRPIDQESDEIHSLSLIPQSMSSLMSVGQHNKFLENDDRSMIQFQGMMNSKVLHLIPPPPPPHHHNLPPPAKRSLYWNDDEEEEGNANSPSTKRFLAADNNESTNSMATILSQLPPQTPSLQQLENLGDGVFGQESYQVQGANWYTHDSL